MKNIIKAALIGILALTFGKANAQSGAFLLNSPDAHTMGMANTGAAMYATSFAMWNNNASTLFSDKVFEASASYGIWNPSKGNQIAVAGYGKITDWMSISAGFKTMMYKPYNVTGMTGMPGDEFKPNEFAMGIGLGFKVLPVLSLSANINYVNSKLAPELKGGAVSADFGAMLDLKFMRVGVTASNIGSKIKFSETSLVALPANVQLGIGTTQYFGAANTHALTVNAQGGMTFQNSAFIAALGVEYKWNDMVRVSGGYNYGDATKGTPSYASAGVGVKFFGVSINAAYLIGIGGSPLGNTMIFSLGYSF